MIAHMELIALDGSGVIFRAFNWSAKILAPVEGNPDRTIKVSDVSVFDDTPVIDGKVYHIACMYSEPK